MGRLGTPVVFLTLCLFPLLHPAPSPSAHGAHRPGGEVRTLLLLGGGREGRPRAGTGLGEALQLLADLGTWVRGANPWDEWGGGLAGGLMLVGTSLCPSPRGTT